MNVKLLLNAVHPNKHLLVTLHASTTSPKHILHEELELSRRLTTGGGDRRLTMSMARARSTWWRSMGGRARSTFAFSFGLEFLYFQGHLVGDLELFTRGIGGKFDSQHFLNDVHDVGSIREMPHNVLTS